MKNAISKTLKFLAAVPCAAAGLLLLGTGILLKIAGDVCLWDIPAAKRELRRLNII